MLRSREMSIADATPWAELLGRYHVAAVHFPIALLLVGGLLAVADAVRPSPTRAAAARACLAFGALGALVAGGLGWLHAEHVNVGRSMQSTLEAHRWWGTAAALFAVATLAFDRAAARSRSARAMRLASVLLAALAVAVAGHLGGSLAYGPDFLWPSFGGETREAEPEAPPAPPIGAVAVTPDPPLAASTVDFATAVRPILEERCYECHGERKQKGRLRLDREDGLFGAQEDGLVVAPGDPAASLLYQRVSLPADHDDRMPSEGDPLTSEQIELLRTWIAQGATLAGAAVSVAVPGVDLPAEPTPPADAPDTTAEIARALDELRALGAIAGPLAQSSDLLAVDFHLVGAAVTDEHLRLLAPLAPKLAELNLARTSITDAALDLVGELTSLEKLDLSNTSAGDDGVAKLAGLAKLEVLNLYGSRVGDRGLESLAALPALRRVFVWQTAVTDAGVAALAARRPEVQVVRGEGGGAH